VAGPGYSSLTQSFAFSFTLTRITMLQNQIPVRRWKQWLALPLLGGAFLVAGQVVAAQTVPTSKEATRAARQANVRRKTQEAMHQDSLKGKFAPGTAQQITIASVPGKPEDVTVTVTRVKADMPQVVGMKLPPTPAPPIRAAKGQALAPAVIDGEHVYTYVEQMPALPSGGGMGGIIKQIQDNLSYPDGPHQEGRVFASFTVGADGVVRDTRIVKGLSPAYDDAVLAAIRKLNRFVPGVQSGQPVAVSFTVPVMFKEKP